MTDFSDAALAEQLLTAHGRPLARLAVRAWRRWCSSPPRRRGGKGVAIVARWWALARHNAAEPLCAPPRAVTRPAPHRDREPCGGAPHQTRSAVDRQVRPAPPCSTPALTVPSGPRREPRTSSPQGFTHKPTERGSNDHTPDQARGRTEISTSQRARAARSRPWPCFPHSGAAHGGRDWPVTALALATRRRTPLLGVDKAK